MRHLISAQGIRAAKRHFQRKSGRQGEEKRNGLKSPSQLENDFGIKFRGIGFFAVDFGKKIVALYICKKE